VSLTIPVSTPLFIGRFHSFALALFAPPFGFPEFYEDQWRDGKKERAEEHDAHIRKYVERLIASSPGED